MVQFVVFDTEYTSWEGSQKRNWSGKGEYKELVKLSAILLSDSFDGLKIIDSLDIVFQPRINFELSKYFIDLTGISQDEINLKGVDFVEGMKIFFSFVGQRPVFSYGNDISILKENDFLYGTSLSYLLQSTGFYDLRLFLESLSIDTKKYTSGTLYKAFNLDLSGKTHDSSFDVFSLAQSLLSLRDKSGEDFLTKFYKI